MSQALEIESGLGARGVRVSRVGGSGWRATTTAICHGGDREDGLQFRDDGRGGVMAKCHTRGCDHASAAKALRERAGVVRAPLLATPVRKERASVAPKRAQTLTGDALTALLRKASFAPTVAQLARKAGVSPMTVRSVAESAGVTVGDDGKMRERAGAYRVIYEFADDGGYKPGRVERY